MQWFAMHPLCKNCAFWSCKCQILFANCYPQYLWIFYVEGLSIRKHVITDMKQLAGKPTSLLTDRQHLTFNHRSSVTYPQADEMGGGMVHFCFETPHQEKSPYTGWLLSFSLMSWENTCFEGPWPNSAVPLGLLLVQFPWLNLLSLVCIFTHLWLCTRGDRKVLTLGPSFQDDCTDCLDISHTIFYKCFELISRKSKIWCK